jgi:hypothetical protein
VTGRKKAEPVNPAGRKGRYTGAHYPMFEHAGKPCTVVRESGPGLWVTFEPGGSQYLVHSKDVV